MSKRLISFSLYGTDARYLDAVKPVVEDVHTFFPGYTPRIYVSQEIEEGLIHQLKDMGAEIIHKERKYHADGMFWRFLAVGDPEAEIVLVRDVDSRMGLRDQQANDAWLASGKDFHIIRDHEYHRKEIMGGLWACRGEKILHIEQLIANWKYKTFYGNDQIFLAVKVYPWIRNHAYIQSDINIFRGEEVHPCPPFIIENEIILCLGGHPSMTSAREIAEHDAVRQRFRRSGKHYVQPFMYVRWMIGRLLKTLLPQSWGPFIGRIMDRRKVSLLCGWIDWLLFWVNRR